MDRLDIPRLRDLRPHVAIAHHVRGRIRLRLRLDALPRLEGFDPALLRLPFTELNGIRSVRINAAALSAVVEYDAAVLAPAWWEDAFGPDEEKAQATMGAVRGLWNGVASAWGCQIAEKEGRA